jgi:hypothetical protein
MRGLRRGDALLIFAMWLAGVLVIAASCELALIVIGTVV